MAEETQRRFIRLFWVLPFALAPALILFGYYEAYEEHHIKSVVKESHENSCSKKSFAPVGSRPCMALSSFPGSGNTWYRHLLEAASGIYTGSIYNDKQLFRAGFHGEYEEVCQGTLLVVKSHRFKGNKYYPKLKFDGAVLIVRNPLHAMISEWNRKQTDKDHVAVASQDQFRGHEWTSFVEESTDKWLSLIEKWAAHNGKVMVTYYEDMKRSPRIELSHILEFLDVVVNPKRLECAIENIEGNFHRKHHQEFDPFTEDMRSNIHRAMIQAQEVLSDHNFRALPEEYFKETIR